MNRESLEHLLAGPPFAGLDAEFAALMARLANDPPPPEVLLAAALVSRRRSEGHVCLDLRDVAGMAVRNDLGVSLTAPPLEDWRRQLKSAPAVVGGPGEVKPLILEGPRVYWRRYWDYEQRLAGSLRARTDAVADTRSPKDQATQAAALDALFPPSPGGADNAQRAAARHILEHPLTILLGGPGTGKTWTVARAIAAWLSTAAGDSTRVRVTAPTGKAVARLQESLRRAAAGGGPTLAPLAVVADRAQTLHRLLGIHPATGRARHDAGNPLPADLVVVDEASMVDLALMAKLADALPAETHWVLLGDRNQLAAVEAGSVLADLASGIAASDPGSHPALASCGIELRENHRFGSDSGIHRASEAVNAGDAARAVAVLHEASSQISELPASGPLGGAAFLRPLPPPEDLGRALRPRVLESWGAGGATMDPAAALAAAGAFRILAAVRRGPYGVEGLNALIENLLRAEGLAGGGSWYPGRPVLITVNDPEVGLYNGDLGVVLPDATGRPHVWFPGAASEPRRVTPSRLPPHETAFALTVHKSQGSEFDRVLLILPDRMGPVLTRELLYTGLTRARLSAEIWSREAILRQTVQRRTERSSGLRERLGG